MLDATVLAGLKPGENRRPCPACDRGPKDDALAVRMAPDGALVWHCHRCEFAGASRPGNLTVPRPSGPPAAERRRGLADYWRREFWEAYTPVCGAVRDYLEARCCVIPPADGDLRCTARLRHPSGYEGPAMIALITDALTGAPLSLHRTWIAADGTKAPVDRPRLLLKGHAIDNGVIRLWPDEAVGAGLGIAEGIESALSLAHGFAPVWAVIDAGHLSKFGPLPGIEQLVIGADHDTAGRNAAHSCAQRWRAQAQVQIVLPENEGCDLNDEVRSWAQ